MTTNCNPVSLIVKITDSQSRDICKHYGVARCHRRCYEELVLTGKAKSGNFRRRLLEDKNYRKATSAILAQLCEPLFPLFDYQGR